jgi:hypothetical protein
MSSNRNQLMKAPLLLTGCLTTLLAAGSVLAGSRNGENLLGPIGMVGQPNNNSMLAAMPLEDFHRVGERLQYVIKDQDLTYHSYHNPTHAIGAGISILAGLNIKEGLDYTLALGETESGKGSFKMRTMMDSLAGYGANARPYVEQLKQRPGWQKVPSNPKLRGNWERLIKAIEEDTDPAELITIAEAMAASSKK